MSHSVPARCPARRRTRAIAPALLAGAVVLAPTAAHAAGNAWLTPLGPGVVAPTVGGMFLTSSPALSGDGDRALFRYFQTQPFALATPTAINPAQIVLWERGSTSGPRIISRATGPAGVIADAAGGASNPYAAPLVNEFELSGNGRVAVFASNATNLVAGDTNATSDVFARQLDGAETTDRVSIDNTGAQPAPLYDSGAVSPSVSDDGRYVAFAVRGAQGWQTQNHTFPATGGGWNANFAALVRDRDAGTTTVAGAKHGTDDPVATIGDTRISGDGQHVLFRSAAADVAAGGVPAAAISPSDRAPVYLRNLTTKATALVGQDRQGAPIPAYEPQVSDDGRYVVFSSDAPDVVALPAGVTPSNQLQVYLRDVVAGTTTLVSAAPDGAPANQPAGTNQSFATGRGLLRLSRNGRYVAFQSSATNLVALAAGESASGQTLLWDRVTGALVRVVVADDGSQLVSPQSGSPVNGFPGDVSDDGRHVGFVSTGKDAVPGWIGTTNNSAQHVYVRDLSTEPAVTTGVASDVTQTAATVAGTLDVPGPNLGFQEAEYRVEYGTSTAYGQTVDGEEAVAGGTEDEILSLGLSGLEPGTTYHYRVVAANAAGTVEGVDRTFTTVAKPDDGGGETPGGGGGGDNPSYQDPPQDGSRVEPPPVVAVPAAVKPFRLTATASRTSLRLATVRRQGLRLTVGVDGAASVRARATVTAATAKRLGLRVPKGAKRVTIGAASATTKATGKRTVRITLSKATRARLARAGRRLAVRVELRASGAGRTTTTVVRTLTVRR